VAWSKFSQVWFGLPKIRFLGIAFIAMLWLLAFTWSRSIWNSV
jgi:hypothetical protein